MIEKLNWDNFIKYHWLNAYNVKEKNDQWVSSFLSLNVTKIFDWVFYKRLIHNLKKRRISTWMMIWIKNFLSNHYTAIRLKDFISSEERIKLKIFQNSLISSMFYLFYNMNLLNLCEDQVKHMMMIKFVKDVNILVTKKSVTQNYYTLERKLLKCQKWARQHDSKFCFKKYELIHFHCTIKRFF